MSRSARLALFREIPAAGSDYPRRRSGPGHTREGAVEACRLALLKSCSTPTALPGVSTKPWRLSIGWAEGGRSAAPGLATLRLESVLTEDVSPSTDGESCQFVYMIGIVARIKVEQTVAFHP